MYHFIQVILDYTTNKSRIESRNSKTKTKTTNSYSFTIWREFPQFPQFPQFPEPENQGFSTVPDYQSLKIVPIFGSMLHF